MNTRRGGSNATTFDASVVGGWLVPCRCGSGRLKISGGIFILAALLVSGITPSVSAAVLLPVSDRDPVPVPHFPDKVHAVVWRNWGLVSTERLAEVLGTTAEKVAAMAESMGLPRDVDVLPEMRTRGYITIIRRNWHLLPYEQLLQILDLSESELAFRLREDDFLYVKLGYSKPRCEPIKYVEPNAEAKQRAAEIRDLVQQSFGDQLAKPQEPRFSFAKVFEQADDLESTRVPRMPNEPPRFIYSYCAMFGDALSEPQLDPFPDGLLHRLREHGVNGVWLHTVLRQLAPGGEEFPEFGEGHEARLANLRRLVQRAKKHGIDVYLYVNEPRAMPANFFESRPDMAGVREGEYTAMCTSDARVRQWMSDALAYVFEQVPDLGGVFTITASENLTNCASHTQRHACPRCKDRTESDIVSEVVRAVEEGVHRSAPDAKVISWDWGWGWAWTSPNEAELAISKLPKSVWVMSVSEWSLPIERGGVKSEVGEYSISAVGPGPRATRHWKEAKRHGLNTIAKVQLNNTWELSSVPYLPVLELVAEHCAGLAKADVDGMMLSWSLGNYPSMNLKLASKISDNANVDIDAALHELAERHFGEAAVPKVRQAWAKFSKAFREYPYNGAVLYNGPQQMGPANLLYAMPTGYTSTMVGFPYDDLGHWRGPYPADVFASQFQKVADGWRQGLADLEAAQPFVPSELRAEAAADLRVAKAAYLHFASSADQARFIMARDALHASKEEAARQQLREEITAILEREAEHAQQMFHLAAADSRLGYEPSNHYFYVPLDLVEKVINCDFLKRKLATATAEAAR